MIGKVPGWTVPGYRVERPREGFLLRFAGRQPGAQDAWYAVIDMQVTFVVDSCKDHFITEQVKSEFLILNNYLTQEAGAHVAGKVLVLAGVNGLRKLTMSPGAVRFPLSSGDWIITWKLRY